MFYQMVKKIFQKHFQKSGFSGKKQFDKAKNAVCAEYINSMITSTAR